MEKKRERRGVRRGCARAEGPAPVAGPGQGCGGSGAGSGPGNSWAAVALCRQRDRQGLPALPARQEGAEPPGMGLGVPEDRRLGSTGVPGAARCEDAPRRSTGGMGRRDHPAWGAAAKACPQSPRGWC